MNICQYLETKALTQNRFAVRLGVSQGLVHQWITGLTRITAERALEIETATDGQVTRYDLRPDIFGKRPREKAVA